MENDRYRIDSQKLVFHPKRVSDWLDKKDEWESAKTIYPIYLEISPVGACNHSCTFCGIDYILELNKTQRTHPSLDAGILDERLHEMGECGVKSVMFAGEGEPLLHKSINYMVLAAHAAGIDTSFTTNGVLLQKLDLAHVSWVKVSLNAGTRDTYAKVHRTDPKDWDRVWRNLEDAVKRKGSCDIGVQMVLLPENQHELPELEKRCADIGVDYVVAKPYSQHKFSITHEYENFIPIVPAGGERTIVREASMATKEIPYSKCQATPYLWAYVQANGDVYSCSAYLLDDRFNLGNLNTHTFQEVWHGEKRRANWEYVRNGLDIHECRLNCRQDKVNRYLDELVRGAHNANFI